VKRLDGDSVQLGVLEIVLPTAGESQCYLFSDLTELLGVEYNSEALDRFKTEWKKRRKRGRLDLDCEADAVSIYGGREAILEAALLIYELAIPSLTRPTPADVEQARAAIKHHKRPPRVPWAVGDIFAAPLVDGTFVVGQVLQPAAVLPSSVQGFIRALCSFASLATRARRWAAVSPSKRTNHRSILRGGRTTSAEQ
jgi:hypothetical protein